VRRCLQRRCWPGGAAPPPWRRWCRPRPASRWPTPPWCSSRSRVRRRAPARAYARVHRAARHRIHPYVTVVQTGTAVDFPNNDTVRHHVYSFSQPKRFEIKLYAGKPGQPDHSTSRAKSSSAAISTTGWKPMCWSSTRHTSARPGADGQVTIAGLPAGRYRLQLWHPLQKAAGAPERDRRWRCACPLNAGARRAPARAETAYRGRPGPLLTCHGPTSLRHRIVLVFVGLLVLVMGLVLALVHHSSGASSAREAA
jgi:hypothetical protein